MKDTKNIVKRTIQILAGLLFLLSGVLKAVDSQSFAILISNYGAVWAAKAAPLISGIEIILGLFLLFDIKTRFTAITVGLMTLVFTVAFTYAYFAKGIEDCGCMGSFQFLKIPPIVSFIRNILIIAGCLWIWRFASGEKTETSRWKILVVFIVACLSFGISGYTLGATLINKNDIHVGDQVNINMLHFYDEMISEGTSIVYIFSAECNHCWNATENVKSIKNMPEFNNVIGICVYGDPKEYISEMKPNFPVFQYPTGELKEIIQEVPVLLVLKDGKIDHIFNLNDIPCGTILKKQYFR